MQKTVLHAVHVAMGAKMVEFGGWHMPLAYTQIRDEHRATRTAAGLFDLSHMGRFIIRGADRANLLDRLVTSEVLPVTPGSARYALLCDEAGGVIDDVVYYVFPDEILLVVNASNRANDLRWVLEGRDRLGFAATTSVEDASERLAMIALQGPRAMAIAGRLSADPIASLDYYSGLRGTFAGVAATIARTGYTGEDGVEVYLPAGAAEATWKRALEAGAPDGLVAVGLGARDTLRLEAAMPLYGHELSREINPLEAGLGFAVKLKKGADFVGRAALETIKAKGPARKLACIACDGKKIPRDGYAVSRDGRAIGRVTSGTFSPTFERPICMALLEPAAAEVGTKVAIDCRGEGLAGEVVKRPFYKRAT